MLKCCYAQTTTLLTMKNTKYKSGDVFGYWTLISYDNNTKKWNARCCCGKEKQVIISHLVKGNSISCSCVGKGTHRMTNSPEYNSWLSMKGRCLNKNNDRYHDYGGRGIAVCERWLVFENFLTDMGARPKGTSLDRIDVDGNYEPSNCRWATAKEQQRNRRIVFDNGLGKSIIELAEEHDVSYQTLQSRLIRGWSLSDALSKPDTKKDISATIKSNSSGVRGVSFDKRTKKWKSQFVFNKKKHWLGRFETKELAAKAISDKRAELLAL